MQPAEDRLQRDAARLKPGRAAYAKTCRKPATHTGGVDGWPLRVSAAEWFSAFERSESA